MADLGNSSWEGTYHSTIPAWAKVLIPSFLEPLHGLLTRHTFRMSIVQNDREISGVIVDRASVLGFDLGRATLLGELNASDGRISFTKKYPRATSDIRYEGMVQGNQMRGSWKLTDRGMTIEGKWQATRRSD